MTPAERNILIFLARHLLSECRQWDHRPSRGELQEKLELLIEEAQRESREAGSGTDR